MSTVPSGICFKCRRAMACQEVGLTLEMWTAEDGRPYYLVQADLYSCSRCGAQVFLEFGRPLMHYHDGFAERQEANPNRLKVW